MTHLSFSFAILTLFFAHFANAQSLLKIVETGARNARLNLVMLSEGYTNAELTANKFKNDATTISNALLNTEPFKSYRPFFNVYGISVASAQSGADQGSAGGLRNTYFNASFYDPPLDRLLVIDSTGYSRANSLLNTFVPEYDIVLVIVNDSKYGGSGGSYAVTSTNASAAQIAIHEIGHSFGGLGDEYDYPGSSPSETPNTTQQTSRALIKWNHWINASTPVPTPETSTYGSGRVGLFQGAAYSPTGWYRPTLDSMMQTLGEPFYAVNEEALVLEIYSRVSPITSSTPASSVTVNLPDQALTFTVDGPSKADTSTAIQVEWKLDGTVITEQTGRTLNYSSSAIGNGTHTLVATVKDTTTKVRKDTAGLLNDSRTWTLNLSNQGPTAPTTLAAALRADGGVNLTWTDASTDEAGFAIERALGTSTAYAEIGRVGVNATAYTDSTTTPGTSTKYRVRGVNSASSSVLGPPSNVVTVTPLIIPAISQDPASVFLPLGQPASFTVQATGTLLKYQWRRNTVNISGANKATYSIASAQVSHVASYDCVVSNALASFTSAAATLKLDSAPIFTVHPLSQTVLSAQPVTFTAQTVGAPTISYQWRFNGTDLPGETGSSLVLTSSQVLDSGRYDCLASNAHGDTLSKVAVLTVNGAPLITLHPSPVTVDRGQSATFTAAAMGAAPLAYQWLKNGAPLVGATSARLTITKVKDSDIATYECLVSNSHGRDLSAGAGLAYGSSSPTTSDYKLAGAEPGSARWLWVQRLGSASGYDSVKALAFENGKLIAGGQSEGVDTKFGSISINAPSNWVAAFDPAKGLATWAVSTGHGQGTRCLAGDGAGKVFASGTGGGVYTSHAVATGIADWSRNYSGSADPIPGIATDGTGAVYLCRADTTTRKSTVAKFASDGSMSWEREVSASGAGSSSVTVTGMVRSAAGLIVICGYAQADSTTTLTFANGQSQPALSISGSTPSLRTGFLAAYDAAGTPVWARMYGLEVQQVASYPNGLWTTGRAVVGGSIVSVADRVDASNGDRSQPSINLGTATAISIAAYENSDFAVLCHVQSTTQNLRTYTSHKPGYVVARFDIDNSLHWVLPVWGDLSLASTAPSSQGRIIIGSDGAAYVGLTLGVSPNATPTQFAGLADMGMTGRLEDGFIARIAEAPRVRPLEHQIVALGGPLHLKVVATADSTARIQWYKNGKVMAGKTSSAIHVAAATLTDAGTYYCKITANGITVATTKAVVNVLDAVPRTFKAPLNKLLDLVVTAAGPSLSYRWWKNSDPVFNTNGFANATTARLRINAMSPTFADSYDCEVTGPGGTIRVNFIMADVMYEPVFTPPVVPASIVSGTFLLQLSATDAASYKVSTLPAGLVYDPKTGRITGKPTTPGSKLITVTANNAAGTSHPALTFTITVDDIATYAKGSFQALVTLSLGTRTSAAS